MNFTSVSLQTVLAPAASHVFMTFATACMNQPFKLAFVWAGLFMVGAVYFIFRS